MPSVGACFPICLGAPQGACGDRGASDGEGDLARPPCPAAGQEGLILTQTKMEKKEKVMAALALLLPRRNCLGDECCHWLVRKQKPTNQTPAQRTAGAGEKRGGSWLRKGRRERAQRARQGLQWPLPTAGVEPPVTHGYLHFNQ